MRESLTLDHAQEQMSNEKTASAPPRKKIFPRRQILIDRGRQLRTAALTTSLAAFLLIAINVAFYVLRTSQTMVLTSVAPQLEPMLAERDAKFAAMLLLISVVFAAGVFLLTIYQTHLTAGAVFAVKRRIDQLRQGDYQTKMRLRPRDNLQDLTGPFNDMLASLREHELADAEELDRLAARIATGDTDPTELAAVLRDLAAKKREMAS
jgi:hypothetical protein